MSLHITSERMTSDQTKHWAKPVTDDQYGQWWVSWRGGEVTRNEAITAMTVAETIAQIQRDGELSVGHPLWPHVESWASELGMSAMAVVELTWNTGEDGCDGS